MNHAADLEAIGRRHGSDKWSGHFYAKPYADHFASLRHDPVALLEIGIGGYDDSRSGGHSLRAWKEYFTRGTIVGLDFFNKEPLQEDRIKTYKGSQSDPRAVASIMADYPKGFDIIIDDGSHRSEHVIQTFYMTWQFVRDGGWYVVEDTQTSYWPSHGGRLNDYGSSLTMMGFFKNLIDGLNWQEIHQPTYAPSTFDREIISIQFYHNMIFIQKGLNEEGSTEVRDNRISGI